MDLIDLLDGPKRPPKEDPSLKPTAPIELMSDFLLLITSGKMTAALKVCDEILSFEPSNKMIADYRIALQSYLDQGLEPEEEEEEEEDGEDDDDGEGEEGESEDDDENDSNEDDNDDDDDDDNNVAAETKAEEKLSYSFHRMDLKGSGKSERKEDRRGAKSEGYIP